MKLSMRLVAMTLGFFIVVATTTALASPEKSKELLSDMAYVVGHKLGIYANKSYANSPNFSRSEYIKGVTAGWNQEKLSPVLQKVLQKMLSNQFNEIQANLSDDQSSYIAGYYSSVEISKEDPNARNNYSLKPLLKGLQDGFDNKKIPNNIRLLNSSSNVFANASNQKASYAYGYGVGRYLFLPEIKKKNINVECLTEGFKGGLTNKALSSQMKMDIKEIEMKGLDDISKKTYSDPNNHFCYAAGYEIGSRVIKPAVNKYHVSPSAFSKGFIDGVHEKPLTDSEIKKLVEATKNMYRFMRQKDNT